MSRVSCGADYFIIPHSRSEINDTLAPVSISRHTTFPAIVTVHSYGFTVWVPVVWCKLSVYASSHKSLVESFSMKCASFDLHTLASDSLCDICGMSYPTLCISTCCVVVPHIQDMILRSSNAVVYPGAACSVACHIWDQPPGGHGVNHFCPKLEKLENAVCHNPPAYY